MRRFYLLFWLGVLATTGCTPMPNYWKDAKPGQKKVLVSFPPLYSLTHAVAGDRAYVLCLLTNEGPHDYQGSLNDVHKVNKADLLIYNGLTLDNNFTNKMLRNHRNVKLRELNVGKMLNERDKKLYEGKQIPLEVDIPADPKDLGHQLILIRGQPVKHNDHWHDAEDPHYWLGPRQAIAMTEIIAAKLSEIDPEGAAGYDQRAKAEIKKLEELQAYGEAAFAKKKNKKMLTMHKAFDYFAKAFQIKIPDTIQAQPGEDPDLTTMPRLLRLCEEQGITVIAVEPQYSDAVPKKLQRALQAKGIEMQIVTLDPLETAPAVVGTANPDPNYYLPKMRENIDALAKALP